MTTDAMSASFPDSVSITGPTLLCLGSPKTFTVSTNAPSGFTWSVGGPCSYSVSGSSVTVTPYGNGIGWVKVMLGSVELARHDFGIGAPYFYNISGPTSVSANGSMYMFTANFASATPTSSCAWSITGMPSGSYYIYSVNNIAYIYFYDPGTYTVKVTGYNACGNDSGTLQVGATRQSSPYMVYPNPVRDILYIDIPQNASSTGRLPHYDIRLFDMQGNQVRQIATNQAGTTVQIDVSGLTNGNYVLHISDGSNAQPFMQMIVKQ